jgi:Spy/CpxP family protein refolding chaperone
MKTVTGILLAALWITMGAAAWAQEHVHNAPASASGNSAGKPVEINPDEIAVFCPTMKTGQLCSSGTANILKVKDEQAQQWVAIARKYNQAVNAATLQLFKDSETVLTPEQQELLKAWFAVGLNPQINDLLFAKGLGPKKIPASAEKK